MTDLPKLSRPATRALENAGIETLEDLAKLSRNELLALHGVGPVSYTHLTLPTILRV